MKKITQLILFIFVIFALFLFNKIYLSKDDKIITQLVVPDDQLVQQSKNNLIKNLKYVVNLDQNNQYIITSDLSELINDNNNELVKMQNVKAIIIDKNKESFIIKSDIADYNNSNYSTKFRNNVSIEYMNNRIFSDKLDLNFENNEAKIFDNVKYEGLYGTITSDNILINLISKKVDLYMNNENDKVQLNKN
tara:strand:+ start:2051 stop:2626 length:576 start_codon:yes stop_codon:yes gene_type:complete